ncbi:nitroreductase [Gordonia polyisoprenivorans]|nr:nitroreductase [Gordonia polyisoprenivorans]QTI69040.1 nitroreductase [Gordonia polyisoprenivorans]
MPTDAVLESLLCGRFSCRAFREAPVPEAAIERMFLLAQRTASWCNSQAWQVHLVSGDDATAFGCALTEWVVGNGETPDIEPPQRYEDAYRERRRAAGFGLYGALGIDRGDIDARRRQMMENFRFFGAPHVAIISSPALLGTYGAVDCGAYVSTMMTAAESLGIATIAQAAIAMHAEFVRNYLGISSDRHVVCAVSFGFPDLEHPANSFRTARAQLGDVISYVSSGQSR